MDDRTVRVALERHWDASDASDFKVEHEIYQCDRAGRSQRPARSDPQANGAAMGKKAGSHLTPEQGAEPTLNDDALWLAIKAAHERLVERTGDTELATIELMQALAQGRLPCMARSTVTGERKPVAPTTWTDQIELLWSRTNGLRVVHRPQPGEPFPNVVKPFRGWVFYVWQPDFETVWPAKPKSAKAKGRGIKPASTKSKTRKADTEPEGPKEARINSIARRFWPPDGKPPANLSNPDIVRQVGDAYEKQRDGLTVDRTTMLRSRT
jgi:hypothetical protein